MKVTAILLAAGQGTRMKSDLPKVLHPFAGKPMIQHALDAMTPVSTEQAPIRGRHGGGRPKKAMTR